MDAFCQNAEFAAALSKPIRRIEIELLPSGLFRWTLQGDAGPTFDSGPVHPEKIDTFAAATGHVMAGMCRRNLEHTQANTPQN